MKNINILLVEDYKLVIVGIKSLLQEYKGFNVVAEAQTGAQAIDCALKCNPDIVLLDLKLPDMSGIDVIKELEKKSIASKIVVLSSSEEENDIKQCLSLGIHAYIIKDINTEALPYIIKSVYNGAFWFDGKTAAYLRGNQTIHTQKTTSRAAFRNSHFNLTSREYEVLKLIVEGKSNNDIANELCISEHTAKAHVCNIIQKLVVDDRTQAAVKALKEGIIN